MLGYMLNTVSLLLKDCRNGGPGEYSTTSYNSECAHMPASAPCAVEDVGEKLVSREKKLAGSS